MTKQPEKPINKSVVTTERWTKSADDRLIKLEKQIGQIEKRIQSLFRILDSQSGTKAGSITYTVRRRS